MPIEIAQLFRDFGPIVAIVYIGWSGLPSLIKQVSEYNTNRMQFQLSAAEGDRALTLRFLEASEKERARHDASETAMQDAITSLREEFKAEVKVIMSMIASIVKQQHDISETLQILATYITTQKESK